MKTKLLAVLFILSGFLLKAQTANDFVVSGYVYDFNDTSGIADYRVMLFEADTTGGGNDLMVEMITDANGYYSYIIPNGSVNGTNRNYKIVLVGCSAYEDEVEAMNMNGSADSYSHDFYICFYESCHSSYVYLTTENNNGTYDLYIYSSNAVADDANYNYVITGVGSQNGNEPAVFTNVPEGVYVININMSGSDCGFSNAQGWIRIPKYDLQDCDATFTYSLDPANNTITCIANATDTLLSDWWDIADLTLVGYSGLGSYVGGDTFTFSGIPYGSYNFIIWHTVGGGDTGCWETVTDTVEFDNTDGTICDPAFFIQPTVGLPWTTMVGINQPGINHLWIYGTDTVSTNNTCTIEYIPTFVITHVVYNNNGCNAYLTDTIGYYGMPDCNSEFYITPANVSNPNEYHIASTTSNLLTNTWVLDGDTIGHNYIFNIVLTGPQTHNLCLTVSGDSCSETTCQQITPDDNTLSGTVLYQDNLSCTSCINDATAYLYRLENTDTSTIGIYVAAADIVNNNYQFTSLPNGRYIIRGALNATNSEFDNYLPTYSHSQEYWEDALVNNLYGFNNQVGDILMLSVAQNPGSGLIGGGVVIEDTLRDMAGENITVFIKNTSGVITKYNLTNSNGNFQLTNLAFGTYTLYADLPGYTCVPQTITISASDPSVSDVEIHLFPSIILGVPNQPEVVAEIGTPYPNPTEGNISIPVNAIKTSQLAIAVYNLLGQPVLNQNNMVSAGNQTILLPTEGLAQGIYILQIADKKTGAVVTKKIVKD